MSQSDPEIYYPPKCADPAMVYADVLDVTKALKILGAAKSPSFNGKGAAYAGASDGLRQWCETTRMPFIPSPMGKGVIPDTHALCMSLAR